MGDSDEEDEMAALRAQRPSYSGGRKPRTADPMPTSSTSAGSAHATAQRSRIAPEDSDSDAEPMAVEAPEPMMMAGLPMSFGKSKKKERTPAESDPIHDSMRRNEGSKGASQVQLGPRISASGTAAGIAANASGAGAPGNRRRRRDGDTETENSGKAGASNKTADGASNGEEEQGDMEEYEAPPEQGKEGEVLPVSHEVNIPAHGPKAVTAITFDPKGARMISGGVDGKLRFWDFGGMTETKNSFREVEPVEGHMVQSVCFSCSGGATLVVCSDAIARIYDRDGSPKLIQQTVKGDMYIRDVTHTKGHTQMLTDGVWHPFNNENWLTSSLDGTLRIWDLRSAPVGMDQVLPCTHVLKILDRRNVCVGGGSGRGTDGGGLYPTCVGIAPTDGKRIIGGCSDGSVQLFNEKPRFMKPDKILRKAHSGPVTGLAFLAQGGDSNILATRSMDETMKIWDLRMFSDEKGPIHCISNLQTGHEKTGVCASPDGRYVVTGTSFAKAAQGNHGTVRVYDTKDSYKLVRTLDLGPRSAVKLSWAKELNQIAVGTGNGDIVMLYSPYSSKKGALHFVGKKARAKGSHEMSEQTMGPIFNFTDGKDIKKFYQLGDGNLSRMRRMEARQNQKTKVPEQPHTREGTGEASFGNKTLFTSLVMTAASKQQGAHKLANEDARDVLLSYADASEKADGDESFVNRAYKANQPVNILDYTPDDGEGDRLMHGRLNGEFCRKCGMKMCRCVDYSVNGPVLKKSRPGTH